MTDLSPTTVRRLRSILRAYLAPRVVDDVLRELERRPAPRLTADVDALAAMDVRRKTG